MGERDVDFCVTDALPPAVNISDCDSMRAGQSEHRLWVNDESATNLDTYDEDGTYNDGHIRRNESSASSRVSESDFEYSAPGKPYHSLLATGHDDSASSLNLIESGNAADDNSSDCEEFETGNGGRPKYEHQNSKIAEIVGHAGRLASRAPGEEEASSVPDDTALAAGAWNFSASGTVSTPIEAEPEDEFTATSFLRQRLKHVFILSNAGKPIYSRYGNEEELSSLMGVMQALVSFVSSRSSDELKSIRAGAWLCVFMHRSPLILVAASRTADSYAQLKQLLFAVRQQIFSMLTQAQLTKIFESRTNFDLRRLLTGSEKAFQNLISLTETNASLFLNAVKIHPMTSSLREAVGQAVAHYAAKLKDDLVFAIVVANDQLVTMARMKRYALHPSDLHLIINLVATNPSFRNGETFAPLCLPTFDKTGFLYAHISYFNDECRACLVLLTVDRTILFTLPDVKRKIVEKLDKSKMLPILSDCVLRRHSLRLNEFVINDLWHFLYKNQSGQFTCPTFDPPYMETAAQKRLFSKYLKVHHRMHTSGQSLEKLFTSDGSEVVVGWVNSQVNAGFELYAVFAPLTPEAIAIAKTDRLKTLLKKKENELFILNPPLY